MESKNGCAHPMLYPSTIYGDKYACTHLESDDFASVSGGDGSLMTYQKIDGDWYGIPTDIEPYDLNFAYKVSADDLIVNGRSIINQPTEYNGMSMFKSGDRVIGVSDTDRKFVPIYTREIFADEDGSWCIEIRDFETNAPVGAVVNSESSIECYCGDEVFPCMMIEEDLDFFDIDDDYELNFASECQSQIWEQYAAENNIKEVKEPVRDIDKMVDIENNKSVDKQYGED